MPACKRISNLLINNLITHPDNPDNIITQITLKKPIQLNNPTYHNNPNKPNNSNNPKNPFNSNNPNKANTSNDPSNATNTNKPSNLINPTRIPTKYEIRLGWHAF